MPHPAALSSRSFSLSFSLSLLSIYPRHKRDFRVAIGITRQTRRGSICQTIHNGGGRESGFFLETSSFYFRATLARTLVVLGICTRDTTIDLRVSWYIARRRKWRFRMWMRSSRLFICPNSARKIYFFDNKDREIDTYIYIYIYDNFLGLFENNVYSREIGTNNLSTEFYMQSAEYMNHPRGLSQSQVMTRLLIMRIIVGTIRWKRFQMFRSLMWVPSDDIVTKIRLIVRISEYKFNHSLTRPAYHPN